MMVSRLVEWFEKGVQVGGERVETWVTLTALMMFFSFASPLNLIPFLCALSCTPRPQEQKTLQLSNSFLKLIKIKRREVGDEKINHFLFLHASSFLGNVYWSHFDN